MMRATGLRWRRSSSSAQAAAAAALLVELLFEPPLWVHALVWPAVVLPLSVLVMRVAKAALIALQWRHRRPTTGEA
jgi:uncharacterized protein (DUF983 family)